MCKAKHSGPYEENAKILIIAKTFTNALVIILGMFGNLEKALICS